MVNGLAVEKGEKEIDRHSTQKLGEGDDMKASKKVAHLGDSTCRG